MASLLAFLFFLLAALFGFLLFGAMTERSTLARRVRELEPDAASKQAFHDERDKALAKYEALRKRFHGVLDADVEKAKVIAQTKQLAERFNAQVAEAKAKFIATKRQWELESAATQAALADRIRAAEAECAAKEQECEKKCAELRVSQIEQLRELEAQAAARLADTEKACVDLRKRFDAEYAQIKKSQMEELRTIERELGPLREEHQALSAELSLVDVGFYKHRYNFVTSERYRKAIDDNYSRQKEMLKAKQAATCAREWMLDGSAAKGRKHTEKTLTLMLRAFNGECDSAIAQVKATNYETMENRIHKSFEAINKLGQIQLCQLSEAYKALRIEELQLEYEHALKVQAEREEQRAIKEEMRQQALAEKEAERAQQEAERERRQYEAALAKAREEMALIDAAQAMDKEVQEEKHRLMESRIAELEQMVTEANQKGERAKSMAEQTRSGHVYVISNIGSFGTNVYKIGMTRRLDPMDRIWELSDASVPFDFDVHAIIYTDDAPGLESELHQRFADRRVNVVNERKEFFHVSIDQIAEVVRERCGDIELTLVAEAAEFLQSEAYRRENGKGLTGERIFAINAAANA